MSPKIGDIYYFWDQKQPWYSSMQMNFYKIVSTNNNYDIEFPVLLKFINNKPANWFVNEDFLKKYFIKVTNKIPNILYGA